MADNTNVIDIFGLTGKQNQLLFSLERYLSNKAVMSLEGKKSHAGFAWLEEWTDRNNVFLRNIAKDEKLEILITENAIKKLIEEVKKDLTFQTPLYLILLECCLFSPFYELPNAFYEIDNASNEETRNTIKKLYNNNYNKISHYKNCVYIAGLLGLDEKYVLKFISGYEDANHTLSGFWKKVLLGGLIGVAILALTAGLATPYIATAFAGAGLSGAAAVSAGLAALGGGAIAVGGLGMAGGIAVIVGGGAILGGVLGSGVGMMVASSPDLTLSQAAKLQVVMKEIILGVQNDFKKIQEIILLQQKTIFELKVEIQKQKAKNDKNKDLIKNLEKSLEILEKSMQMSGKLI